MDTDLPPRVAAYRRWQHANPVALTGLLGIFFYAIFFHFAFADRLPQIGIAAVGLTIYVSLLGLNYSPRIGLRNFSRLIGGLPSFLLGIFILISTLPFLLAGHPQDQAIAVLWALTGATLVVFGYLAGVAAALDPQRDQRPPPPGDLDDHDLNKWDEAAPKSK